MTPYLDNPAGRLLAVLQSARKTDPGDAAINGWARVLGIETDDNWQVLRFAARLTHMAVETRALIAELEEEEAPVILANFNQVETTLAQFLVVRSLNMETFLSPLDPRSGEHCLELCSVRLHRRRPEPELTKDQRGSLLGEVDELLKHATEATELDDELRAWLVAKLRDVREALKRQALFSTRDVEATTDEIIGGIIRHPRRGVALARSSIGRRFWDLLGALEVALSVAVSTVALTAGSAPPPTPSVVLQIEQRIEQHIHGSDGSDGSGPLVLEVPASIDGQAGEPEQHRPSPPRRLDR